MFEDFFIRNYHDWMRESILAFLQINSYEISNWKTYRSDPIPWNQVQACHDVQELFDAAESGNVDAIKELYRHFDLDNQTFDWNGITLSPVGPPRREDTGQ